MNRPSDISLPLCCQAQAEEELAMTEESVERLKMEKKELQASAAQHEARAQQLAAELAEQRAALGRSATEAVAQLEERVAALAAARDVAAAAAETLRVQVAYCPCAMHPALPRAQYITKMRLMTDTPTQLILKLESVY
jgi:chromosome segregation ATPase